MKPRIVFDTNIYISAFLYGGKPRSALDLARSGLVQLLISMPLKLELQRVLRDKFSFTPHQLHTNTNPLWEHAEWIAPRRRLTLCPDEPDNRVLEYAIEGMADFVVTGDRHLLALPAMEGPAILNPADFMSQWSGNEPLT